MSTWYTIQGIELFKNQTIDGNGTATRINYGKLWNLYAFGAFGGGTVEIQWSVDEGTTWTSFKECGVTLQLTSPDTETFLKLNRDTLIRATLTGSTAADITVELR